MNERLKDLYWMAEDVSPQDVYLLDLVEQCAHMEMRVREMMEKCSVHDRQILECYLDLRDELEFQTVKTALRYSKNVK